MQVPKPKPRQKTPKPLKRTPVARVNAKRKPLKSSGPIKPKPRKPGEFARIYGSKARVEWVKAQPCVFANPDSACEGMIENAHIECGGYGRKADYCRVVPICKHHHGMVHWCGTKTMSESFGIDLAAKAADTERRWQAFQELIKENAK